MNKKLVVDSSVLSVLSRRGTLEEFLRRKKDEGYEVLIPRAIAKELMHEPKKYAEKIKKRSPELVSKILDSIERVNAAIEQGLIQVETMNYRKYSRTMDNIRKHLSKLEAEPEHTLKKGDMELITLVIQLYDKSGQKVFVSTKDKGLLRRAKAIRQESLNTKFKKVHEPLNTSDLANPFGFFLCEQLHHLIFALFTYSPLILSKNQPKTCFSQRL